MEMIKMKTLPNSFVSDRSDANLTGKQILALMDLDHKKPGALWDTDALEEIGVDPEALWIEREHISGNREKYLARKGWLPDEYVWSDAYLEEYTNEHYTFYVAPDYDAGFIVFETMRRVNNQLETSDISEQNFSSLRECEQHIVKRIEEIASEAEFLKRELEESDED